MYTARDMVNVLGKKMTYGNADCLCDGLNLCNRKTNHTSILSYAVNDSYLDNVIRNTAVKMLIVGIGDNSYNNIIAQRNGCIIFSENPEMDFYKIHEVLCKRKDFYEQYDFVPVIGLHCDIHPSAVIDKGVKIGNNVKIGALTVIKKGTVIEDGVEIGCNTVIGSEGFQVLSSNESEPLHVTHVGGVHIGRNVCIGDCTCIANSLFEGETYIGSGAKIDNLVHIGHNLFVGENAVITPHVTLCGSCVIEKGVWVAPNSSILNRVVVGKYAKVGMGSVVTHDIPAYSLAYGVPARVKNEQDRL